MGTVSGRVVGSGAGTPAAQPLKGVNDHPIWYWGSEATIKNLYSDLGVQASRIDIIWEEVETSDGSYNSTRVGYLDNYFGWMADLGVSVTAIIGGAPSWASNGSSSTDVRGLGTSHVADYADFCGWVANRWSGQIEAIEIWNEPAGYWAWAPSGVNNEADGFYASVLQAAYPAIKAEDSSITVLSGSLFSGGQDSRDREFVTNLYANGGADYFDVMAVHAYRKHTTAARNTALPLYATPVTNSGTSTNSLIGNWEYNILPIMETYSDGDRECWLNEAGYAYLTEDNDTDSLSTAASVLTAQFEQMRDRTGSIPANFTRMQWYMLGLIGSGDDGWGLVTNDDGNNPTPSNIDTTRAPYTAFKALTP